MHLISKKLNKQNLISRSAVNSEIMTFTSFTLPLFHWTALTVHIRRPVGDTEGSTLQCKSVIEQKRRGPTEFCQVISDKHLILFRFAGEWNMNPLKVNFRLGQHRPTKCLSWCLVIKEARTVFFSVAWWRGKKAGLAFYSAVVRAFRTSRVSHDPPAFEHLCSLGSLGVCMYAWGHISDCSVGVSASPELRTFHFVWKGEEFYLLYTFVSRVSVCVSVCARLWGCCCVRCYMFNFPL